MSLHTDNRTKILSGLNFKNYTSASSSSGNITITAAILINGGIFSQDPEGNATWTLDTGANINSALSDLGHTAASGDTLSIILHNAATASSGEIVTLAGNTNVTLNGNATISEGSNSTMKLTLRYDGTDWQAFLGNRNVLPSWPTAHDQILNSTDGSTPSAAGDDMGFSMAQSGNYCAVGRVSYNSLQGIVTIFKYNGSTWAFLDDIVASDAATGDLFGYSVAMDGTYLAVGAPVESTNNGAVYIFERDTGGSDNWGQVTKLTPSTSSTQLGTSVAILDDGTNLLAFGSAGRNDTTQTDSGAVHRYDGNNSWTETIMKADTPIEEEYFGGNASPFMLSVSTISGVAYLAVGSSILASESSKQAVYIFGEDEGGANNWGQIKRIVTPHGTPATSDTFGHSVSLVGQTLVVGAYNLQPTADGEVYIFEQNEGGADNWGTTKTITSPDTDNNFFGGCVALDENGLDLIISNSRQSFSFTHDGLAHHYHKNRGGTGNWGLLRTFTSATSDDNFGSACAVDISLGYMIVSASISDVLTTDAGDVRFYKKAAI